MLTVIDLLNRVTGAIAGAILEPFRFHPAWGMTVISLVAGALLILLYKLTSSQEGIRESKDKIWARFYELRLFQHDVRLLVAAQANLVRSNLRYLSYSLVPLLFMIPPVVLLLAQLHLRYGLRPLVPGDAALLKVEVREGVPLSGLRATCRQGDCVEVVTEAVRIPSQGEAVWRLEALRDGRCTVEMWVGGEVVGKEIVVAEGVVPVSPRRVTTRWWELILMPGEPSLSSATVAAVEVGYPHRDFRMVGIRTPWWLAFFILSLVFGFALKYPLRVQI